MSPVQETFEVAATSPFDAVALLSFLGKRTVAGVETYAVEPARIRYARTVRLPHGPGMMELVWTGRSLLATTWTAGADREEAAAAVARLCDADAPAPAIAAHLARSEPLRRLVAIRPGLRVPGTVDAAEMAFRTLIGQQISLAAAATGAAKLAAAYGEPVELPDPALTRLFPAADALAAVDPDVLAMPRRRGRALVGLARAVADGTADLTAAPPGPQRRKALLALPGIGPWTVDYLAMRAFGDRDVLLDSDLVVKRELARREVTSTAEWAPYRSYATMHLWFGSGVLTEPGQHYVGIGAADDFPEGCEMGIFDKAKDALGGDNADKASGQQQAEKIEGLAGRGDTGTPPEDMGQPAPEGIDDPLTPGQSASDAVRSPIAETNP